MHRLFFLTRKTPLPKIPLEPHQTIFNSLTKGRVAEAQRSVAPAPPLRRIEGRVAFLGHAEKAASSRLNFLS